MEGTAPPGSPQPAIYSILWACVSSWYYGFHLAELNFPAESLTCISPTFPPPTRLPLCLDLDAQKYGFVTAIYTAGGLIGSLISSWVVANEGVKGGITWTGYLNLIGALGMTIAPHWGILAAGRFVAGLSSGIAICLVPPFLAHIARASPQLSSRSGQVGTLHQMGIVLGLFTAQATGLIFTGSKGDIPGNWRYITAISGVVSAFQIFFAPHIFSPTSEPSKPTQTSRPRSDDIEGLSPVPEVDESASPLLASQPHTPSPEAQMPLRELLSNTSFRGPTILCAAIMVLQQLSGVNAVMFYSTPVLKPLLPTGAGAIGIGITLVNALMTIVAIFLIDRLGRRSLLLSSIIGMAITSALLAYGLDDNHNILSAVAIILFIVAFAIGLGPIPFLLVSEMVPSPGIPALASLSLSLGWIANFLIAILFLPLRDFLSTPIDPRDPLSPRRGEGRIFYLFTGICILTAILVWRGLARRTS